MINSSLVQNPPALVRCPHLRTQPSPAKAEPAESYSPGDAPPTLAPDHSWLAQDFQHTPVPSVPLEAWKNAKRYDVVTIRRGMSRLS